ncbi:acyl-CoA dehydrogenase family protein [Speluncibacter jeojiensis]|uniref:Acyl-CoA dehydrogenase family protein n=1 Tax=Speluncibacter jeojiensis TaxID=2710754 RepID=A0A9X4RF95_9ACTN|nr:acyl-CoA dehydrogenase family protein [Corynebacteriales bacterium D3-21]
MSGDREFAELLTKVFRGAATDRPEMLDAALWSTLANLGLARLTGRAAAGGSGAGWADAALLLGAAGRVGAAIPVAENDLLAGWLLERAGLDAGRDPAVLRTAAVVGVAGLGVSGPGMAGVATRVPWARAVDSLVLLWETESGWRVAEVPRRAVAVTESDNFAGEPRDAVRVDLGSLDGGGVGAEVVAEFRLRGALARSLTMVGAMERVLELVVEHTTTRTQFGRPVAGFQAVQQLVADLAAEAALARAAGEAAVDAVSRSGFGDPRAQFAVAAAKSCAGHAASLIARNAHQCLGAIGFTDEHELHRHTTRLLAWRGEFGSVRWWDERLTRAAAEGRGGGLWSLIVD